MSIHSRAFPRAFRWPLGRLAVVFLQILSLALFASPVAAKDEEEPADLSGTYELKGTFPNGNEYTGTVEIKKRKVVRMRGNDQPKFVVHDLKFHYSSGWDGIGVGTVVDGRFYFALAHQGKFFTFALCRDVNLPSELKALQTELKRKKDTAKKNQSWFIKGDPWFQDVWQYPKYSLFFRNDGDWGTEGIRLPLVDGQEQDENPAFGPGEWWWFQRHYNDKGKDESAIFGNHGNMVVEAPGEEGGIKVTRKVWDSKHQKFDEDVWDCAGMMVEPGVLLIGMGGDDTSGVGYYEFDGKTLKGKICDVDGLTPYEQTLAVPDDVAAKNARLFH